MFLEIHPSKRLHLKRGWAKVWSNHGATPSSLGESIRTLLRSAPTSPMTTSPTPPGAWWASRWWGGCRSRWWPPCPPLHRPSRPPCPPPWTPWPGQTWTGSGRRTGDEGEGVTRGRSLGRGCPGYRYIQNNKITEVFIVFSVVPYQYILTFFLHFSFS